MMCNPGHIPVTLSHRLSGNDFSAASSQPVTVALTLTTHDHAILFSARNFFIRSLSYRILATSTFFVKGRNESTEQHGMYMYIYCSVRYLQVHLLF
jgi:hypothetical protein